MPVHSARRLAAGFAVAAVGVAAAPAAASAATIRTNPCSTAIRPAAGQQLGPQTAVAGSGFLPTSPIRFAWNRGGGSGGTLTASDTGTFNTHIYPPRSILSGKHVRAYALTATSTANPAVTATRLLKVVRFDTSVNAKHPKPRQRIKYTFYGYPRKQAIWAHYVFHGKVRRNLRLGKAKGSCGLLAKRVRTLPTRVHIGVWHIYLTNHRKLPHKGRKRKRQILDSFTYRHVVVSARRAAAASAGATGDRFSG